MPDMPTPKPSQKQIAARYLANLTYNNSLSPLRRLKLGLGLLALLAGLGATAYYLSQGRTSPKLEWINNSGAISQAHAGFAKDCQQCHAPLAGISPLEPLALTGDSIDASCLRCHAQHTFHQANVTVDHSCVACHHEHLGAGPMQPVADLNCRTCHANAEIMAASEKKGASLPPSAFESPRTDSLVYFHPPRPPQGYTKVVDAFDGRHPDFQIQRDHLTDPDTLKFNHHLHLTGDIPSVDGKKLDCAYCHQPDARGAYMQQLTFARNCQACHALQIDPTLPDFQVPHPQANTETGRVRDFLLTLPTQYTLYASRHMAELHLTEPAQISAFVQKHMEALRLRTRRGEDLIRDVFFADARQVLVNGVAGGPADRALFPGCVYCHEVKPAAVGEPIVTAPVVPDRWLVHARFDHSAHRMLTCEACHDQARQSEKTSDILMPEKASCVTCHSAKGGVVSTCVTCHGYHNPEPASGTAALPALRNMMLGGP